MRSIRGRGAEGAISKGAGFDTTTSSFPSDVAIQAWKVKVVLSAGSLERAGAEARLHTALRPDLMPPERIVAVLRLQLDALDREAEPNAPTARG
jgi:hypothetical protein